MKRKFKKTLALLLGTTIIASLVLAIPANASTTQELQAQINALQSQLNHIGADQKEEAEYQNVLNQQIDALNAQLGEYQSQLNTLNAQVSEQSTQVMELNNDIAEKNQLISDTQAKAQETMDQLKLSMRSDYMNGSMSWFEALLGSEDFGAFISNLEYVKRIAAHDQELKDQLDEQVATIKKEKQVVEQQQQEAQQKLSEVEASQSQVSAVQSDMQSTANQVESKLQESKNQSKQLNQEYQQTASEKKAAQQALKEAQAAADAELARAREEQNNNGGGSGGGGGGGGGGGNTPSSSGFICPLPSGSYYVSQPYGGSHTGVDLAAGKGTPIYASKSGTVISAQYWDGHSKGGMQSYGNMVQILHDDGSSTLYAHCNSISASKGQRVSQGQTIGTVGTTGNSSGNHLHFEMQINGQRVNPMYYI